MRQMVTAFLFLGITSLTSSQYSSQTLPASFVAIDANENISAILAKAASVRPSARQIAWQEREFSVFIHFGMNTFTDREWGRKNEDPTLFNPTQFDAHQWARVAREAGAGQMIVVAKHHDGFCLWPSKWTDCSVKQSRWKEGRGDVIAEVAAACEEEGLKLGIYLSPWDMSSPV